MIQAGDDATERLNEVLAAAEGVVSDVELDAMKRAGRVWIVSGTSAQTLTVNDGRLRHDVSRLPARIHGRWPRVFGPRRVPSSS
jgi:hypothetical protein